MTKKKLYDSKTTNGQRISIWIIAIVMGLGTLLTFFVMAFAGQNPDTDPAKIAEKKQQDTYNKYLQSDEYKTYLAQQKKAAEERQATLRGLDGYADKVASFDAGSITKLKVETLKEGDGATVASGNTISANYTGWMPDGKIFDSTKVEGSDATAASFSLSEVIEGWSAGLVGTRAGGIYLLSIPSGQAYGSTGSSDGSIPADTPLRFLVQIVSVTSS